jgi:uncharacterized membrane protein
MDALWTLLHRHPLIIFHLASAVGALLAGAPTLARRKGTPGHRALGWGWVVLMAGATLSSAFIGDELVPNVAGFTPIHALTLPAAVLLPTAIVYIRRGNVAGHRKTMRGLYLGGCIVAGIFTLLPGRFLGSLLWGAPPTGIAG